jgi:hypothetical protein
MTYRQQYTQELEELILETLLPIYDKYYFLKGIPAPTKDINPDLLARIVKKDKLPALLRPYEN